MQVLGGGRLGQIIGVVVGLILRFTLQEDLGGRHPLFTGQLAVFQNLSHDLGQALAQVLGNLPALNDSLQN
jgi:hypothetical protein